MVRLSWVSQWDRPYDAFHMVVDLCQVLNLGLARCWDNEDAWVTNQEEGRWASRCWKLVASLRAYNSMGGSRDSANKIWQVVEEHSLTCDVIYIFMPFSKNFQWEFFKSRPQIWVPYVRVGSTRAYMWVSNMWLQLLPLSLTCPSRPSYLRVPFFAFSLMAQSDHVNGNQSQGEQSQGTHRYMKCAICRWLECVKACKSGKWSCFCCVESSCEGVDSNQQLPLQCKLCMNFKDVYFGKVEMCSYVHVELAFVLTSTV